MSLRVAATLPQPPSETRGESSGAKSSRCGRRFAQFAGETTAECVAICCCCPCGLINLLILTIYKLPAGLCRQLLRKRRRKKLAKKGLLPHRPRRCECGCDDTEIHVHPMASSSLAQEVRMKRNEEMEKMEMEMLGAFCSTGFWRTPSQRETPNDLYKKDMHNITIQKL